MENEEKKMPETEEAEESNENPEKIEQDMETGKRDADVYSEEGREELEESDAIEPSEAGFMEGAEGKGEDATCKQCEAILPEEGSGDVVAREINGKRELFCSEKCADVYEKEHQ